MKTGFVIAALTFGLLAGGMTGASLAGDGSNAGSAGLYNADPQRALGWDYQAQGPIETGALSDASGGAHGNDGVASDDAGLTFVEFGGARYRVGLDTGP